LLWPDHEGEARPFDGVEKHLDPDIVRDVAHQACHDGDRYVGPRAPFKILTGRSPLLPESLPEPFFGSHLRLDLSLRLAFQVSDGELRRILFRLVFFTFTVLFNFIVIIDFSSHNYQISSFPLYSIYLISLRYAIIIISQI
jgi:hypothetical protein